MLREVAVSLLLICIAVQVGPVRAEEKEFVKQAQQVLKQRGYDPGPIDGQGGKKTGTALRAFQKDLGLEVTGRFDQTTLEELGIRESMQDKDSGALFTAKTDVLLTYQE